MDVYVNDGLEDKSNFNSVVILDKPKLENNLDNLNQKPVHNHHNLLSSNVDKLNQEYTGPKMKKSNSRNSQQSRNSKNSKYSNNSKMSKQRSQRSNRTRHSQDSQRKNSVESFANDFNPEIEGYFK